MPLPTEIQGWSANEAKAPLKPITGSLPKLNEHEVLLEVLACGVCHSDIHLIDNDWMISKYPLVPGHEILGRVLSKGSAVTELPLEAVVGVGWQRGCCGTCPDCLTSRENLCDKKVATCVEYWGGYADYHVTDSRFCFLMPKGLEAAPNAPLLCGGATVFTPLTEFLTHTPAARVGVVGLGGLGHLAVKLASAMGCEVTLFSSSPRKKQEALDLGAHHFVSSTDSKAISSLGRQFDLIIATATADLPVPAYVRTLRTDGTLCFVGIPPSPMELHVAELLGKRLRITASSIASRATITDMLQFCALHKIGADVEVFPMDQVNEAITKVRANQIRHRAVLVRKS